MTETLTIRLPQQLARDFKAKARAAKTNPTAVLRRAAVEFVRRRGTSGTTLQDHIRAYAGTWDGLCTGTELLRRTRP